MAPEITSFKRGEGVQVPPLPIHHKPPRPSWYPRPETHWGEALPVLSMPLLLCCWRECQATLPHSYWGKTLQVFPLLVQSAAEEWSKDSLADAHWGKALCLPVPKLHLRCYSQFESAEALADPLLIMRALWLCISLCAFVKMRYLQYTKSLQNYNSLLYVMYFLNYDYFFCY